MINSTSCRQTSTCTFFLLSQNAKRMILDTSAFISRLTLLKICRQKLGMVLENKVVQKLKLEKKVFYKKWSPKLIFLNEFFF